MSSAVSGVPRAARRWPSAWGEVAALAATAILAAIDSGDGLARGLRSLVDERASNIGDPWPTVVAAGRLAASFHAAHAAVYEDFSRVGASFIYPPLAALPFTPLASLGYEGAHRALAIVSRVAWLACALLAALLAWNPRRRFGSVVFAAVGALGFYPLLRAVELNQATLLVTVAIGAAFVLIERGREGAAGAAFATACAFKPQLALVLILTLWRSRRFLGAGLATLAGLGAASLVYAGLANHIQYLTGVLPVLSAGYAYYPNQSWNGAIQRLAGMPALDFAMEWPSPSVRLATALASAATLAAGAWTARRAARAEPPVDLALLIGFGWVVVTLASPISWDHHYATALLVFALLWRRAGTLGVGARRLACAAFPLIAGFIDVLGFRSALGRVAMSYVMFGGVLLAVALGLALLTTVGARAARPGDAPRPSTRWRHV